MKSKRNASYIDTRKNLFFEKDEYDELVEMEETGDGKKWYYDALYPTLNDPNFSWKIANREEFENTKYDGTIFDIKKHSNELCDLPFEIEPHQLFMKKFMSSQTPYNSILLYQGLGSGKTCNAIGISELYRKFIKQMGLVGKKPKIFVIASKNVQENFRLQLFDSTKLKKEFNASKKLVWSLNSCVGSSLLNEINPMQLDSLTKKDVISYINSIIDENYRILGYDAFANMIDRQFKQPLQQKYHNDKGTYQTKLISSYKKYFNNRLIIIDEAHYLRLTDDETDKQTKKTTRYLMEIATYTKNMKIILITATPIYNSPKEIVTLLNIMNTNDKRPLLDINDIFEMDGTIKEKNKYGETGEELLRRKMIGYVSYVRGENPYAFPFRIYPIDFNPSASIKSQKYPTIEINGSIIKKPIQYIDLFANIIEENTYQRKCYEIIVRLLRANLEKKKTEINSKKSKNVASSMNDNSLQSKNKENSYSADYDNENSLLFFENSKTTIQLDDEDPDQLGYQPLLIPSQALNITFPNDEMMNFIDKYYIANNDGYDGDGNGGVNELQLLEAMGNKQLEKMVVSNNGFDFVMDYTTEDNPKKLRHHFKYKSAILKKYGRIFSRKEIGKYSKKIENIIDCIMNSKGIVLIHSKYIWGGILPICLALEELGFGRFSTTPSHNKRLMDEKIEPIDAITMQKKSEVIESGSPFQEAKYMIITGDEYFSPSTTEDLSHLNSEQNKNGEFIKVVFITDAGSEGVDFKNVRQVHIMDSWFAYNKLEQIIGRGVRYKSHCKLPFEERNVELYLHTSLLENSQEECADTYVYRFAEKKAIKIGKITRIMKEMSVDCVLNIEQTNFTAENFLKIIENQDIELLLSSGGKIKAKIGDKKFSSHCDFMDNCEYKCFGVGIHPKKRIRETQNDYFLKSTEEIIKNKIIDLFLQKNAYTREEIIKSLNVAKKYPITEIYYVLSQFINNPAIYNLRDGLGRKGIMVNKEKYYLFQPEEIDSINISIYERTKPVQNKRDAIEYEISNTFESDSDDEETQREITKSLNIQSFSKVKSKEINKLQTIINEMISNYQMSKKENSIKGGSWYSSYNESVKYLQETYEDMEDEFFEKALAYHMLDFLYPPDKLIFANYMIGNDGIIQRDDFPEELEPIREHMESYFLQRYFVDEDSGKNGLFLLNADNVAIIYLWNDEMNKWVDSNHLYDVLFHEHIAKFKDETKPLYFIMGFITIFNDTETMTYKTKNMSEKRNNLGVKCDKQRKPVIDMLNAFLQDDAFDIDMNFMAKSVCVMAELLMRYFQETEQTMMGKEGGKEKVHNYFLNPEQSANNVWNIAKI